MTLEEFFSAIAALSGLTFVVGSMLATIKQSLLDHGGDCFANEPVVRTRSDKSDFILF